MRLVQYINEQHLKNISDFTILDIIRKKCKTFLKEMKGGDLLWRGTDWSVYNIRLFTPRTDRRPRDTDEKTHEYMDIEFKKYHGWKARSEGVFTSSGRQDIKLYGSPYAFFPIGNYKYLWNPKVKDLKFSLADMDIHSFIDIDPNYERWTDKEEIENAKRSQKELTDLIKGYKSTNLKQATVRDSEVMFKCKHYYLVDAEGPLFSSLEELLV